MDKLQLLSYKNRLLNLGVPYAVMRRNLRELQDHHDDLLQQALAKGMTAADAKAEAARQLGDSEQLVNALLARPELRSRLHRFPIGTTVLLPLLAHFFICALVLIGILFLAVFLPAMNDQSLKFIELMNSYPQWFALSIDLIRISLMYVITPILGCIFAFLGIRNHLPKRFWLTGLVLLCLVGSSLHVHLAWPDPIAKDKGVIGVHYGAFYGEGPEQQALRYLFRFTISFLLCGAFARAYSNKEQTAVI